jgi:hypothetical protein
VKDFHSFRTTWITLALSAGVPMELVRRVTGHTTTDVVLKHYFRPGRDDFKKTLQSAMPKMLTQSAIDGQSDGVQDKPPTPDEVLEQALKALKGLTEKNLKKQRKAVATLIRQAKKLIAQSTPDKSASLTGATLAPAKALPVAAA